MKEQLKKQIKKALKKANIKTMFYMTSKQMANNTATIWVSRLFDERKEEVNGKVKYTYPPISIDNKAVQEKLNAIKQALKEIENITLNLEVKKEYGLEYLYIRISY